MLYTNIGKRWVVELLKTCNISSGFLNQSFDWLSLHWSLSKSNHEQLICKFEPYLKLKLLKTHLDLGHQAPHWPFLCSHLCWKERASSIRYSANQRSYCFHRNLVGWLATCISDPQHFILALLFYFRAWEENPDKYHKYIITLSSLVHPVHHQFDTLFSTH